MLREHHLVWRVSRRTDSMRISEKMALVRICDSQAREWNILRRMRRCGRGLHIRAVLTGVYHVEDPHRTRSVRCTSVLNFGWQDYFQKIPSKVGKLQVFILANSVRCCCCAGVIRNCLDTFQELCPCHASHAHAPTHGVKRKL